MKIRIANVWGGAARTLLVAGTLAVAAVALAQISPYAAPGPVSHAADDRTSLPQIAKDARARAMKVELAWLADSVTSPCRLEARIVDGTLEVHGQVPSEADLAHALQLARAESGMRVVSRVQLNPRLRALGGSKPQDVLHQEAFNALRQGFPEYAPSTTVSTLADGQIVLKGTVRTYEDKLAISRLLRQATSCSCVVNELQVTEPLDIEKRNAPALQSPSRGATATLLPPERIKPQAIQPVSHMPSPSPSALSPAPGGEGRVAGPDRIPTGLKASATDSAEVLAPKSTALAESSRPHPAEDVRSGTLAKPATKPVVYRTKWRRLDPSEVAMPKKTPLAYAKTPGETALASRPQVYFRVIPSPTVDSSTSSGNNPLAGHSALAAAASQNVSASTNKLPPALMQAQGPPPAKQPYVSEGVVIMESTFKPASHSVPMTGQKPAVVRTGPYVTSGVILFSDSGNEEVAKTNPALASLQTRLQQRIAAVCGKPSKDIEVKAVTETEVTVRLKANSTLEGEELSNRIFQLPELGPCQVSLDVLVMK